MTTPQITVETAAAEYLRDYAWRYSRNSLVATTNHVRRFVKECSRTYLHELLRYDLNKFLAQWEGTPRRLRRTVVNNLMRWASKRYHLPLPLADGEDRDVVRQVILTEAYLEAQQRWAIVKPAAEGLLFPHQRAIFLCGFLYLFPLVRVHRATLAELLSLPQRDDFYRLLNEVSALGASRDGPLFRPWLGQHLKTAEKHWREWTGVQFRAVVKAGEDARYAAGISPGRGRSKEGWRLPAVNEENVKRLPRFWE